MRRNRYDTKKVGNRRKCENGPNKGETEKKGQIGADNSGNRVKVFCRKVGESNRDRAGEASFSDRNVIFPVGNTAIAEVLFHSDSQTLVSSYTNEYQFFSLAFPSPPGSAKRNSGNLNQ